MTYVLTKRLCPVGLANNPNRNMVAVKYITIHDTGNYKATANAAAHANLLYNGTGGASWHYTVDKDGAFQSFDDAQECRHAGDGNDGPGNYTSIGIEICVNDKAGFARACENAAALTADLLKKHGLSIEHVVQHNRWTGKNCPAELRSGAWGVTWAEFIDNVKGCLADGGRAPIIGPAIATVEQAWQWAKRKGATDTFTKLAAIYWESCSRCGGVNPVAAYCQAAKETGYGKFGGVLDETYCNPCGMKTGAGGDCGAPVAHMRFKCWEDGVKAHLDHLVLYAGAEGYPRKGSNDPRHFPYLWGTAKTVEELGGKWAPSKTYGEEIVKMMKELEGMSAPVESPAKVSAIPDWQIAAFHRLTEEGVIKSPDYWENRLGDNVTVGELFAVIANL